jgi:hypothetical protein
MAKFSSILSIEKVIVEQFTAYIYVKILTPNDVTENKGYFFCAENTETGAVSKINENYYYIERFNTLPPSGYINIGRNKTVCLRLSLLDGRIHDNTYILSTRILFKEKELGASTDKTVWKSDTINMSSIKFYPPSHKIKLIKKTDGGSKILVKLLHDNSLSESVYNTYMETKVFLYDGANILPIDTLLPSDVDENGNLIFVYDKFHDKNVTKITASTTWINGKVANETTISVDTMKAYNAYYFDEFNTLRIKKVAIRKENVVNVLDIYQFV